MKIAQLVMILIGILSLNTSLAHGHTSPLNRVHLALSEEAWVSTKTAKVMININATLDKNELAKARGKIRSQLQKIAKGDWHITQFNRRQSKSGLEQLNAMAEARVSESLLGQLYENAKSASKPGTTYRIQRIQFTPSLSEMNAVRATLRKRLYQAAKAELTRLNDVSYQIL